MSFLKDGCAIFSFCSFLFLVMVISNGGFLDFFIPNSVAHQL